MHRFGLIFAIILVFIVTCFAVGPKSRHTGSFASLGGTSLQNSGIAQFIDGRLLVVTFTDESAKKPRRSTLLSRVLALTVNTSQDSLAAS
jgi:hypothetical protein